MPPQSSTKHASNPFTGIEIRYDSSCPRIRTTEEKQVRMLGPPIFRPIRIHTSFIELVKYEAIEVAPR